MDEPVAAIARMRKLWRMEHDEDRRRYQSMRDGLSRKAREVLGVGVRGLDVEDMQAASGGRTRLWLARQQGHDLQGLNVGPGDPVLLTAGDTVEPAVVVKRRGARLAVLLHGDPSDEILAGGLWLERDADNTTFNRGDRALRRLAEAPRDSDLLRLQGLLFGTLTPRFETRSTRPGAEGAPESPDALLNEGQRQALERAATARDIALIHGPPGTGKTRTLVALIQAETRRGASVLATAASNTAVDNIAVRLVDAGLQVVRLGHPARVSPALESQTLDALVEQTPTYHLTLEWIRRANDIRRRADRRRNISFRERREMLNEAWNLMRDAREQVHAAERYVLDRADVICTTATGADNRHVAKRAFDVVVLDEATQCPDPIAAIALARGTRWFLAGDPQQLPPTVLSREAADAGLGSTFFERLAVRCPDAVTMLETQYRMAESIMAFPSMSMYDGRLVAAPGVGAQRITDLEGVSEGTGADDGLIFIDTAGKGWNDVREQSSAAGTFLSEVEAVSVCNPDQAERTAAEVRRLLERGVLPDQLAVITPYRAQVGLLRTLLEEPIAEGLEVRTVDGFQGREKDVMIVDLVRSNAEANIGFLRDTRRMNVALTRARKQLVVIGDSATIGPHAFYASFLDAVEAYGVWTSVWDD